MFMIRGQTKYTTQELRLRYKNSLVKHIPNERAEMRNQKGPSPTFSSFFSNNFIFSEMFDLKFCSS